MPPLAETIHEVRQAILQEQTAKEKLIFALLHPSHGAEHQRSLTKTLYGGPKGLGNPIGHPVGTHHEPEHGVPHLGTPERKALEEAGSERAQAGFFPNYAQTKAILMNPANRNFYDLQPNVSPEDIAHMYEELKGDSSDMMQAIADARVGLGPVHTALNLKAAKEAQQAIADAEEARAAAEEFDLQRQQERYLHADAARKLRAPTGTASTLPPTTALPSYEDRTTESQHSAILSYMYSAFKKAGETFDENETEAKLIEDAQFHGSENYRATHDLENIKRDVRRDNAIALSTRASAIRRAEADAGKRDPMDVQIDEGVTLRFQDAWSGSVATPHSVALQEAVLEKFGLPEPDGWSERLGEAVRVQDEILASDATPDYQLLLDHARSIAEAQYQITQEWYKEHRITHLTLFRGMKFDASDDSHFDDNPSDDFFAGSLSPEPDWIPWESNPSDGSWQTAHAELFPLSSWTNDEMIAHQFASDSLFDTVPSRGYVLAARIPVERIIGNGITGVGAMYEGEHVVIGGNVDVAIGNASSSW